VSRAWEVCRRPARPPALRTNGRRALVVSAVVLAVGCDRPPAPEATAARDEAAPRYRNVDAPTGYVGDQVCAACHADAAAAYQRHAMARSFHRWTSDARTEAALDQPLYHEGTGFHYRVIERDDGLYQEESLSAPDGRRLHELSRRIDYVMGSGEVARTYFTEENGRLFQLPLTWYRERGWDFSPGYERNNARFDRLLPDGCLACHGSPPERIPFLEGKYASLPPGIGCERCHGPGELHSSARAAGTPLDSLYDDTIVNPSDLPLERRLDVCEQCHVHTPVTVLREGQDPFSYRPSQRLSDHRAFFKISGSIDIVSHADRLRQSPCYVATRATARPLECASCHDPHQGAPDADSHNGVCRSCHALATLERRLASSAALAAHEPGSDCVACHMPPVKERTIPHGSFTDHWIRVVTSATGSIRPARGTGEPIEAYYERDVAGPDAALYRAMGAVIYGTRANETGLLRDAADALDRAIGADSTLGGSLFLLGLAYRELGRPDASITALERSLRLDPDHPERLQALARAYEAAGREPEAIAALYERALALQPALAWIRADYADFLQAQDRNDEAEAAYRAALTERPSLDVAAFNLGTLLMGQGRLSEAGEVFERAVHLDPSLAEALSPLLLVAATGDTVTGARIVGAPLGVFPVRPRLPGAVQLIVGRGGARRGALFVNVPPGASLEIRDPDGTLVRALPPEEATTRLWDLETGRGTPIAGGLYRVEVRARAAGRSEPAHRFLIGVVRVRGS